MIFIRRAESVPSIFDEDVIIEEKKKISNFYNSTLISNNQNRYDYKYPEHFTNKLGQTLRRTFNKKCAFCESPIKHTHKNFSLFRPPFGSKGILKEEHDNRHYWWLAYEWRNFYYSCNICNQFKSSYFPVLNKRSQELTDYDIIVNEEKSMLVDPCNDLPQNHLSFLEDGSIESISEKGSITIDVYKLNRNTLKSARRRKIQSIFSQIELFDQLLKSKKENSEEFSKIESKIKPIYTNLEQTSYLGACMDVLNRKCIKYPRVKNYLVNKGYVFLKKVKHKKASLYKTKDISDVIVLETLELRNFKCIEHLKLSLFDLKTASVKNWKILIGENSTGKSTILKAIAIALMDKPTRLKLLPYLAPNDLLMKDKSSGWIKLNYNNGKSISVSFSKNSSKLTGGLEESITNIVGYGAFRALPNPQIELEPNTKKSQIENLFNHTCPLINAISWLLERDIEEFNRCAIVLKEMMLLGPNAILIQEHFEKKIFIRKENGEIFEINEYSDGYKSIFALTVDILASIATKNIPFNLIEGIILVDELGLHLHPRWKMQIVEKLRLSFPRIQFIASTHDPLCLRGLMKDEVVVLKKNDENKVLAIQDLPDPSELRVDQILTSEFFGLNSTIDPKFEKIMSEYYGLLSIDNRERSESQNHRLEKLREVVLKTKSFGLSKRDELFYYVIDELLAKKPKSSLKIDEELKQETLKKVKSIWNSIN